MQRLFVEFDQYEIALLNATRKRMIQQYRARGKKPPSLQDVIRGAVRVALHLLEGENAVFDPEELRSLLEESARDTCLSDSGQASPKKSK